MSIKKILASAGLAAGAIAAMAGTASASPSATDLVNGADTLAGAADFAGSTVVNTFADRLGVTHYVDEVAGR
ncbi:hypothetical protein [Lentzea sp.]|uniref:hypothetical protein n=1 Tax=Lentzea sp. TaxID=56099 RepID=UPI002BA43D6A|nr:hypothetical protein [Lentzea sp.]HUQ58509.1 hypothetical protein [Lentzea sp.]